MTGTKMEAVQMETGAEERAALPAMVDDALSEHAEHQKKARDAAATVEGWRRDGEAALAAGDLERAAEFLSKHLAVASRLGAADPPLHPEIRTALLDDLNLRLGGLENAGPRDSSVITMSVRPFVLLWVRGAHLMMDRRYWPMPLSSDEEIAENAVHDFRDNVKQLRERQRQLAAETHNALPTFVQNVQALYPAISSLEEYLPKVWRAIEKARHVRRPGRAGDNFTAQAGWHWEGNELEGVWTKAGEEIPAQYLNDSPPPGWIDEGPHDA